MYLLHHIVTANKDFRAGVTVRSTRQHRRGDVQDYRIDDDHPLGVEQNLVARLPRHNQMQPRPKHDRLASDHRIPANGQQKDRKPFAPAAQDGEVLEDEAQRVRDDAEAGNHQTPEVEPLEFGEGAEDEDQEFHHVVHGQAEEEGDDDFEGQAVALVASCDAETGGAW